MHLVRVRFVLNDMYMLFPENVYLDDGHIQRRCTMSAVKCRYKYSFRCTLVAVNIKNYVLVAVTQQKGYILVAVAQNIYLVHMVYTMLFYLQKSFNIFLSIL
jgi:hypothetical protein